jgi:hypothetical protein
MSRGGGKEQWLVISQCREVKGYQNVQEPRIATMREIFEPQNTE